VPATLLWRRRHGAKPASTDVLLLLALLFLARCVLDAANNGYYHLPFLVALASWEALERERPPVVSVAAAGLVWLTVVKLPGSISPDAQCATYLAWALPALAALAYASFRAPLLKRPLKGGMPCSTSWSAIPSGMTIAPKTAKSTAMPITMLSDTSPSSLGIANTSTSMSAVNASRRP